MAKLNRRGDRRGMNGRGATRGTNGKFVSTKTNPTDSTDSTDSTDATQPDMAGVKRRGNSYSYLNTSVHSLRTDDREFDDTRVFPGGAAYESDESELVLRYQELTAEDSDDGGGAMAVAKPTFADLLASIRSTTPSPVLLDAPPILPPVPSVESQPAVVPPVAPPIAPPIALSFEEATSHASMLRLWTIDGMTDAKPRSQALYRDWVTLQCCRDRMDTGVCAPHVLEINVTIPSMTTLRSYFSDPNVSVQTVSDGASIESITTIFKERDLIAGTDAEIAADMLVFSQEPFYTVSATRNGEVVGGCVFRAHNLNNGERLVQIELIATKEGSAAGVGTSIMRVMRGLSQVSALHTGHVAAFTLRSKSASRFYARKLPESGPTARALLLSVAMLDPLCAMPRHLEMRSVVVRPAV